MLLGLAGVRFADTRRGIDLTEERAYLAPITREAVAVDWDGSEAVSLAQGDLQAEAEAGAEFAELAPAAARPKSYQTWSRDLAAWIARTQALELRKLGKEVARPGESERDFRARLQQAAREHRDLAVERLRQKYAAKIAALDDRERRAEHAVAREAEQATQSQVNVAVSVGATILGALLGRKAVSASTVGRATTAARGASRVLKERQDIGRARANLEAVRQQKADLAAQLEAEVDRAGGVDPLAAELETVAIKPSRSNVAVRLVALAWVPSWRDPRGGRTPAWR
jgi:hypothetical protein